MKLFEVCRSRRIPVITVVNKWDRPGLEALELLDEIEARTGMRPTPLTWPVGIAGDFKGVIDRSTGEFVRFHRTPGGSTRADEDRLEDWERAVELYPCRMTILGDTYQAVNPDGSSSLETIADVFPDSHRVRLGRSYRSTLEIAAYAQHVSPQPRPHPLRTPRRGADAHHRLRRRGATRSPAGNPAGGSGWEAGQRRHPVPHRSRGRPAARSAGTRARRPDPRPHQRGVQ